MQRVLETGYINLASTQTRTGEPAQIIPLLLPFTSSCQPSESPASSVCLEEATGEYLRRLKNSCSSRRHRSRWKLRSDRRYNFTQCTALCLPDLFPLAIRILTEISPSALKEISPLLLVLMLQAAQLDSMRISGIPRVRFLPGSGPPC